MKPYDTGNVMNGADAAEMLDALPEIPRDEEGPVFREPWEAQAFAMTLRLYQQGLFTWPEWAETLTAEIKRAQKQGDPDRGTLTTTTGSMLWNVWWRRRGWQIQLYSTAIKRPGVTLRVAHRMATPLNWKKVIFLSLSSRPSCRDDKLNNQA